MGPVGLWYRKDLFEKAGITPDDVSTYDGFIEAGKELQAEVGGGTKMTAFDASGGGTNPSHYHILLNQQDGSFYGPGGRIDFTNEKSYRAMDLLDRFVNEDIAVDTPTYDEISRAISNGDAATDMGVEYAPIMVAAVIGLIPLVLLFFFFQKYIVSGVFGGSLKE